MVIPDDEAPTATLLATLGLRLAADWNAPHLEKSPPFSGTSRGKLGKSLGKSRGR